MSDQFVAEIRIFPFNFAPRGWALCAGQILPISQYAALFSLLGTSFGGNGTSNFQLPNLQGMTPLDFGNGAGLTSRVLGETGGTETVTLLQTQMPQHNHPIMSSLAGRGSGGEVASPAGASFGPTTAVTPYVAGNATLAMNAAALPPIGGNQPHNNLMPYLTLNFCIALTGIFPARN